MVMDGNQTYCGDHFAMYTNTKSLCCTPETNIMLYINYISIFLTIKLYHFTGDRKILFSLSMSPTVLEMPPLGITYDGKQDKNEM